MNLLVGTTLLLTNSFHLLTTTHIHNGNKAGTAPPSTRTHRVAATRRRHSTRPAAPSMAARLCTLRVLGAVHVLVRAQPAPDPVYA